MIAQGYAGPARAKRCGLPAGYQRPAARWRAVRVAAVFPWLGPRRASVSEG